MRGYWRNRWLAIALLALAVLTLGYLEQNRRASAHELLAKQQFQLGEALAKPLSSSQASIAQQSQPPLADLSLPLASSLGLRELARHDIPMPKGVPAAHASFLLIDRSSQLLKHPPSATMQKRLRVFWFAGSRESGADVEIWASTYTNGKWSEASVVVNRHKAQQSLGSWLPSSAIRRLGNPVAWMDASGRTHLYVVATAWLGGWAASRILHLRQAAHGGEYVPISFLALSPFFNLSHLVRGAPIDMADGGALLPAYFELGVKYPLSIRLDAQGELVPARAAVVPMDSQLFTLQPTVAVMSPTAAIAYLRDNSSQQRLRFASTQDSGQHWQSLAPHESASSQVQGKPDGHLAAGGHIINPDASIAALRVAAVSTTLLVHNPQTSGRHRLVIDASSDGLSGFRRLAVLEDEPAALPGVRFNEYSYPSAVIVGDQLHVSYTYQKRFIRHVIFALETKKGN